MRVERPTPAYPDHQRRRDERDRPGPEAPHETAPPAEEPPARIQAVEIDAEMARNALLALEAEAGIDPDAPALPSEDARAMALQASALLKGLDFAIANLRPGALQRHFRH